MIVPGSNLLGLAMMVVAPQLPTFFACTGATTTVAGERAPTYAAGVPLAGSFQPLSRARVSLQGLDFEKNWATFFVSAPLRATTRLQPPDQLEYGGRRWEVTGGADWLAQDGWTAPLLVDVGPAGA